MARDPYGAGKPVAPKPKKKKAVPAPPKPSAPAAASAGIEAARSQRQPGSAPAAASAGIEAVRTQRQQEKRKPVSVPGPVQEQMPSGPPVKALQAHGVQLGIQEVNDHVQQIQDAHDRAFGTPASPGLTFDLLRATHTGIDYDTLFGIPKTTREARAQSYVPGALIEEAAKVRTPAQEKAMFNAAFGSELSPFISVKAVEGTSRLMVEFRKNNPVDNDPWHMTDAERMSAVNAAGFPGQDIADIPARFAMKAAAQIVDLPAQMPFGFKQMGSAVGFDLRDMLSQPLSKAPGLNVKARPLGTRTFRTAESFFVAKDKQGRIVGGVAYDVMHPMDNPGYLILDIWTAITLGAGAAVRTTATAGAVKAAAAEGASVTDLARIGLATPLHRPVPGHFKLGVEGHEAIIPLSENAARRIIQQGILSARQRRLMAQHAGLSDVKVHGPMYDEVFDTTRKIARERHRNLELQFGVMTAPSYELARLSNAYTRSSATLGRILKNPKLAKQIGSLKSTDRIAMEKAIEVIFTDDPQPFAIWKAHHSREIGAAQRDLAAAREGDNLNAARKAEYRISNHMAQLNAVDLAERMIKDPPKRFKAILNQAFRASQDTEWIKRDFLGLDPDIMEQQVPIRAAMVRGDNLIDLPNGKRGIVRSKVLFDEYQGLQAQIDRHLNHLTRNVQPELNKARAGYRKHPGSGLLKAKFNKFQKRWDERQAKVEALQNRMEEIQAQAEPVERKVKSIEVQHVRVGDTALKPEKLAELHSEGRIAVLLQPEKDRIIVQRGGIPGASHGDLSQAYADQFGESQVKLSDRERGRPVSQVSVEVFTKGKPEIRVHHEWDIKLAPMYAKLQEEFPGLPITGTAGGAMAMRPMPMEIQDAIEKLRPDEAVASLREGTPDIGYSPWQREVYKDNSLMAFMRPKRSPTGVAPPGDYIFHRNTGASLTWGDKRWDTTALLIEDQLRAGQIALKSKLYKEWWDSASTEKTSPHHVPIRNIKNAPEDLKRAVAAMQEKFVAPDKARLLTDDRLEALQRWVSASDEDINKLVHREEVRWMDERLILDSSMGLPISTWKEMERWIAKPTSLINEPYRLTQIFLTPAYLLNAGGAFALSLAGGSFRPSGFMKAIRARDIYGPEATRVIDTISGETMASAIIPARTMATKLSEGLMQGWQQVTDKMFRRMTAIYELERRKVIHPGMSHEEALDALRGVDANGNINPKVVEAAHATRGKMLDFNRISWPERALLRHTIFIYTFMRASLAWAIRFQVENPTKANLGAQLGRGNIEDQMEKILLPAADELGYEIPKSGPGKAAAVRDLIGGFPDWYVKHGYVAMGHGLVVDPMQANMPIMLTQAANPLGSLFATVPYASPNEVLGPVAKLGTSIFGKEGPDSKTGGRIGGSFIDLLRSTSFGYAFTRASKEKKNPPIPPPPLSAEGSNPIAAALLSEGGAVSRNTFEADNFWRNQGLLIGRTAIPRKPDGAALMARYWRDLKQNDPTAYHQHELAAVRQLVRRQAEVVGHDAPEAVNRAVDFVARVSQKIDDFTKEWNTRGDGHSTGVPEKNLGGIVIDMLLKDGRIDKAEAKKLRTHLNDARTPFEAKRRRMAIMHSYAGGKAWYEWNSRVSDILQFHDPSKPNPDENLRVYISNLKQSGGGDYSQMLKASKEQKWQYARNYYAFADQAQDKKDEVSNLRGAAAKVANDELKIWLLDHDKAARFPSYEAMRLARLEQSTPGTIAKKKRSLTLTSWQSMTPFERELVKGETPSRDALLGWHQLDDWMKQTDEGLSLGQSAPQGAKEFFAKYIGERNPAFKADYEFAHLTRAERMLTYKPILQSRYASQWKEMLEVAARDYRSDYNAAIAAGYAKSSAASLAREIWTGYRAAHVRSWVETQTPGFRREVNAYYENHPDFIEGLVR